MKKLLFIVLSTSLLVIGGCSQVPNGDGDGKIITELAKDGKLVAGDLCEMLTPAMVSEVLGYEVVADHKTLPQTATATGCDYESLAPSKGFGVTIIANYDNEFMTAAEGYQQAVDYQKNENKLVKVNEFAGLGDKAVTTEAPLMTSILSVKGKVWVTLSRASKPSQDAFDKLKQVTEKAFEVL